MFAVQLLDLAVIRATVEVMVEAMVVMQVKQVPIALAITGDRPVEPVEFPVVPAAVVALAVPVLGRRVPIQSGLLRRLIVI